MTALRAADADFERNLLDSTVSGIPLTRQALERAQGILGDLSAKRDDCIAAVDAVRGKIVALCDRLDMDKVRVCARRRGWRTGTMASFFTN